MLPFVQMNKKTVSKFCNDEDLQRTSEKNEDVAGSCPQNEGPRNVVGARGWSGRLKTRVAWR